MKYTLAIIKPDATRRPGVIEHIQDFIAQAGFRTVRYSERKLSKEEVEWLYREHKGKDFFQGQVDYMLSGHCVLMVLYDPRKGRVPERFRVMMGNKDRTEPNTIRYNWGIDYRQNSIHGSDNNKSAQEEIAYFYPELGKFQ